MVGKHRTAVPNVKKQHDHNRLTFSPETIHARRYWTAAIVSGSTYFRLLPYLLMVRHAGNTNTAVITLPHMGNSDNDLPVQFGNANSAGS